jgi:hypothetical protein
VKIQSHESKKTPTRRWGLTGGRAAFSSPFLRLSIFLVGRRSAARSIDFGFFDNLINRLASKSMTFFQSFTVI